MFKIFISIVVVTLAVGIALGEEYVGEYSADVFDRELDSDKSDAGVHHDPGSINDPRGDEGNLSSDGTFPEAVKMETGASSVDRGGLSDDVDAQDSVTNPYGPEGSEHAITPREKPLGVSGPHSGNSGDRPDVNHGEE